MLRYAAIILILFPAFAPAQPTLLFKRAIYNSTTVELYFNVQCDGADQYPTSKQYFKITDNGQNISQFTLWSPDPRQRCAISAALVFDGSDGSVAINAGQKQAGHAFIGLMDGIIDEAAVMSYNTFASVLLPMTIVKADLNDAVNGLASNGGSAVWDGIYAGIQHVAGFASNPCRAVVVVASGPDNASLHSVNEIITLANMESVRVFIVGVGQIDPANLQDIALMTGGTYFHTSGEEQLRTIFEEIFLFSSVGFGDCTITYENPCRDGAEHTVELTLQSYCQGGNVVRQQKYISDLDSKLLPAYDCSLADVTGTHGRDVVVPLLLNTPIEPGQPLGPVSFLATYNDSCMKLMSFTAPPGTLLEGGPFSVTLGAGSLRVDASAAASVFGTGTLGWLTFRLPPGQEPSSCAVDIEWLSLGPGCRKMVLHSGNIEVRSDTALYITPLGALRFCEGGSVVLKAPPGFRDYYWSTGETTEYITVTQSGIYNVQATIGAVRKTSQTVSVMVDPVTSPDVMPSGFVQGCLGKLVALTGEPGYQEYIWSNGIRARTLSTASAGTYTLYARSFNGCWAASAPVQVAFGQPPSPKISGMAFSCSSVPERYSVAPQPGVDYWWVVHNGRILGSVNDTAVVIAWEGHPGFVQVTGIETASGCWQEDIMNVYVIPVNPKLAMDRPQVLCPGDRVRLTLPAGYESYTWSNGVTDTNTISVDSGGAYYCVVTNAECTGSSDTVQITILGANKLPIAGDVELCKGNSAEYSAPAFEGLIYEWSVTNGVIDTGAGTPVIRVLWPDAGQGSVTLRGRIDTCVSESTIDVEVFDEPSSAISVTGDTGLVCSGDTILLTSNDTRGKWLWNTADTTRTIAVTQTGDYTVTVTYAPGCKMQSDTMHVEVRPRTAEPMISRNGLLLTCTIRAASYRWYVNDSLVQEGPEQTYLMKGEGVYRVTAVTEFGCAKSSPPFAVLGIGSYAPALARSFSIAPNPNNGAFEVALEFDVPTAFSMRIVNTLGQTVYSEAVGEKMVSFRKSIELDSAPGVYFFLLESGGEYDYKTLVVR